ncbi:MAG: hypothetical protein EON93_05090 [Burkholderiales bacterium]|nr:MAG: hypothetical protein EON93_05090 [Burkholderiales bacterium]
MADVSATTDVNTVAAVASAVAAAFSAGAAFLTWLAQVRQIRESVRPELVIDDWVREVDPLTGLDSIKFSSLKNVGRGAAKNLIVNSFALADDDRPTHIADTIRVPSIAAGEVIAVDGRISLLWKAVPKISQGSKFLGVNITLLYWDSVGVRHKTLTNLLVVADPSTSAVANQVAPGVGFGHFQIESVPVWRLQFRRRFSQIPLFGRLLRADA